MISPSRALYIKLGGGGEWERSCLDQGILRLGYNNTDHNACVNGDWDKVHESYVRDGTDSGAATRHVTQIREFYEADESTLWITFHANSLWWCFSEPIITLLDDGTKVRPTLDGWHCDDIEREPLLSSRLKGSVLALQGFRGTICNVRETDYVVQKINGQESPEVKETEDILDELYSQIEAVIRNLHWHDFEILVDLVFRQAGWQRLSELGGKQKTVDLEVYAPVSHETYGIQIKSQAGRSEFDAYRQRFSEFNTGYARVYFIVHSPSPDLGSHLSDEKYRLILPHDFAKWVVDYGLVRWVLDKVG